jgi:hypothetical protein
MLVNSGIVHQALSIRLMPVYATSHARRMRRSMAHLKKFFGMPPAHIWIVFAFNPAVAEIMPTIDDLLGGTAADSQLQSPPEIRSAAPASSAM